jgi:coenzyme F420-reducing hydrogenase beta subunit
MKPNVIETIVKNNLCIGCGVCAGVCPANALKMEFNIYGEFNPVRNSGCLEKCNFCLKVCPFYDNGENEDSIARALFGDIGQIKYRPETGYYLESYVGYSRVNAQREKGASGGMITWILENLLTKKMVDHVVCVTPNDDPERLFRFAIFNDVESIRQSAKSAYYPVEMSEVIRELLKKEGRYVITGQPCFLKGLRLAVKRNKKLRENIIIMIGLVCGQMKSKHYTTCLASLSGINGMLKKVNYRGKSPYKLASNFFFHCVDENNCEGKLFWDEGVSDAWINRWFTPFPCNYCDDIFAEVADVTVMDAWLPEYLRDSKGTNLLISRSSIISDILDQGRRENQILIEDIAIEKVIQAQLGVLNVKRNQLAHRLYQAKKSGRPVPKKRVLPSKKHGLLSKKEVEFKDKMQVVSRELFLLHYNNGKMDLKPFLENMTIFINDLHKWDFIRRVLLLPIRALRKTRRILFGKN